MGISAKRMYAFAIFQIIRRGTCPAGNARAVTPIYQNDPGVLHRGYGRSQGGISEIGPAVAHILASE
jgi:hypothetical protein